MALEKHFIFRISEAEYEWLRKQAYENRISVAEYLRQLIDDDMIEKGEEK